MNDIAEKIAQANGKDPKQIAKGIEEAKNMLKEPPSKEQVIEWFKTDIHAAQYALTALIAMPEILDQMAAKFYDEVTKAKQMPVEEKPNMLNKKVNG